MCNFYLSNVWSHQTFSSVYSVLPEAVHFKTLPHYRYLESPVQPFLVVIYYSALVCECWNHSFFCPNWPIAGLHPLQPLPPKTPWFLCKSSFSNHSASWSWLHSPQPAHPSANNVLVRQEHPWKASYASCQRCEHQIFHKVKDGKGSLPVVAFLETSPKVPVEHTQEKRGRAWWHGGNFGLFCSCLHGIPVSNHGLRSERLNNSSVPGQ